EARRERRDGGRGAVALAGPPGQRVGRGPRRAPRPGRAGRRRPVAGPTGEIASHRTTRAVTRGLAAPPDRRRTGTPERRALLRTPQDTRNTSLRGELSGRARRGDVRARSIDASADPRPAVHG